MDSLMDEFTIYNIHRWLDIWLEIWTDRWIDRLIYMTVCMGKRAFCDMAVFYK